MVFQSSHSLFQQIQVENNSTRLHVGVLQVTAQSASTGTTAAQQALHLNEHAHTPAGPLNWAKQWYPVYLVDDLDPKRPHAVTLLNKKVVLWRDASEAWRVFRDRCAAQQPQLHAWW
jgi:hypothetical protein